MNHPPLIRRADWQAALDTFLIANAFRRFRYGDWDCALFVCDAVQTMTGVDLAATYRGAYTSRRSALEAIRARVGRGSVKAAAEATAAEYGLIAVPIVRAARGDVALIRRKGQYSLGIIALNGRESIVPSKRGLWRLPLAMCAGAWRI